MAKLTRDKKWNNAFWLILEFTMGTGATSALPTPTVEVPKQLILSAADFTLCWKIYKIYYDEEITGDNLAGLLERAGIVTVVGGALIYAGAKALQGLIDEGLNLTGVGTLLSGIITGATTATIGFAFLTWVHDNYAPAVTVSA